MARNSEEYYPEKVVILNGPSLGTSLKLILFGAVLGSAGTLYWLRQNAGESEAVEEGTRRAKEWWQRGVQLAARATGVAKSTFPQWQEAVNTAKATAAQTEQQLHHQIEESDEDEPGV